MLTHPGIVLEHTEWNPHPEVLFSLSIILADWKHQSIPWLDESSSNWRPNRERSSLFASLYCCLKGLSPLTHRCVEQQPR